MDNQADQVAEVADEATDAAAELDRTVRKSNAAQTESGKKSRDADEAGSNAAADAATTVQGKTRGGSAAGSSTAQGSSSAADSSPEPDSSRADAEPPSLAKPPDARRSDVTVPKAAVPPPSESRPQGNGRADMLAKPLGASAPDPVVAPAGTVSGTPADTEPASENESTSSVAAASMARELTGAGFARPGFERSSRSGHDASSRARTPSPGAKPATPSTTETNPAWRSPVTAASSPTSAAGAPAQAVPTAAVSARKDTVSTAADAVSAPAVSDTVASAPARPTSAGQIPSAAGQVGSASGQAASAPGQAASEQSAWSSVLTPPSWSPSTPAATSQAPPAPTGPPTQGPAAPAGPAYSPSGSPGSSGSAGLMGVDPATATRAQDRVAAPQPQTPAALVRSLSAKFQLASPFTRPGSKKKTKLKPSAIRRPGGAIGSGRPTMTVGNRPGTLRQPAQTAQTAPRPARPSAAEVRDAQLVLTRIEPWSVFKFSFLVSLVGWIVLVVGVAALYYTFSSLGVFHVIEKTVHLVTTSKGHSGTNAGSWFSAGTVLGYTMAAGVFDAILIVALSTIGAAVYNLVARMTGGIEITLQEAD